MKHNTSGTRRADKHAKQGKLGLINIHWTHSHPTKNAWALSCLPIGEQAKAGAWELCSQGLRPSKVALAIENDIELESTDPEDCEIKVRPTAPLVLAT